jgi:hypothetical protein
MIISIFFYYWIAKNKIDRAVNFAPFIIFEVALYFIAAILITIKP